MNLYIEYTAIQIVRGIHTQSFRKKIKMDVEQNKYTNHHTHTYKHTVTELHIHNTRMYNRARKSQSHIFIHVTLWYKESYQEDN